MSDLKPTPTKQEAALDNVEFMKLCADIQNLEQRALKAGLYITCRALNAATRAARWERAGNTSLALQRALDRLSPEGAP